MLGERTIDKGWVLRMREGHGPSQGVRGGMNEGEILLAQQIQAAMRVRRGRGGWAIVKGCESFTATLIKRSPPPPRPDRSQRV